MKLRSILFAAFASALVFSQGARAADLVVATDTAFVPFEFKEGDKYVGFDIDMWDAIAKEIGVTYTLQPMDFNGIIPALQTKQVDVALAGITIKDERKKAIDFSDGYYDSGFLLMVPADSAIKGADDLKGKILATKTGTSATVTNTFRLILDNNVVLNGIVMWTQGVSRPNGALMYKCPEGDVTGPELAACTLWNGVIYTTDEKGEVGLLPAEGIEAPKTLILPDLGPVLDHSAAHGTGGFSKVPGDVFTLKGCQE